MRTCPGSREYEKTGIHWHATSRRAAATPVAAGFAQSSELTSGTHEVLLLLDVVVGVLLELREQSERRVARVVRELRERERDLGF